MTDRVRNGLTVFMLVILAASAFAAGYLTRELVNGRAASSLAHAEQDDMALFQEAWGLIENNFLGTLPDSRQVTYGAIRGSLATLNDPYTVFVEPAAREVERERLQGTFGGIGAYISRSEETGEVVLEPIPGNPAEAAGVLAGDVLLAVDGQAITAEMTVPQIVDLVKGEKGTAVLLTLRHPGAAEPVEISVVRDDILLPSVVYRLVEADPTIGYIQLSRFSGESSNEVGTAIQNLQAQGATRLILDLRQNGGGLRDAAVDVVDHFLDDGPVLYLESQEEGERVFNATPETLAPTEPLVVLVDGGTASASEIVAGALQDRGRATLIGGKTFGKGSVQGLYTLSDSSVLHLTTAKWQTPAGREIDGVGITPKIQIPLTPEDTAKGLDPQLERAIQYLNTGK